MSDRRDHVRREPAPRRRGRRVSPGLIFVGIAIVGSIAYVLYAITVRDASQIPLLASGAVVLALAFAALAIYCLSAVMRAGTSGRGGRALLISLVGGGAAIATAGCLAAAVILFGLATGG
ncbi:hypothetical protein BH20CHL7_BH20CHL7_02240 [soil metagenome]